MNLKSLVAGKPIDSDSVLTVRNPYDQSISGTVTLASRQHALEAIAAATAFRDTPTRFQRSEILEKTRSALESRREEFARINTSQHKARHAKFSPRENRCAARWPSLRSTIH